MSDERKTRAELMEEVARLRREAADLRAALGQHEGGRPLKELPGDYNLLFETFAEPLLIARVRDGLILRANPCGRRLLGLAEGDLGGLTIYDLMPPAARAPAAEMLRQAAAGNHLVLAHDVSYARPDGSAVSVRVSGAVVDSEPEATALFYLQDVLEERRIQRLLRDAQERYRLVVEAAADPIFMIDAAGRFMAANAAAGRTLGRPPEDIVGKTQFDLFPPEIAERQARQVREVFQTGRPLFSEEIKSYTAQGPCWFSTSLAPVHDEQSRVQYVIGIARDVTESKRVEEALRESEARYRAVVDTQTELVVRFVEGGVLTFVNEAYCRYFGKSREELVGASFLPWLPEEDRRKAAERFAGICPARPIVEHEHRVVMPSGEVRWMHWVNRGVFDDEGRLVEVQAVGRDVTERRAAEDALRESEQELKTIYEGMQDGILIADAETRRFVRVNPAILRMFGYAEDEVLRLSVSDIHPKESLPGLLAAFEEDVRGERTAVADVPCLRKDGTLFYVDITSAHVTLRGRLRLMGLLRDITERKAAQEALRRSEENYRLLFEECPAGVAVTVDGRVVQANRALCAIWRMDMQQVIGRSAVEFVEPPQREVVARRVAQVLRGEAVENPVFYRIVRGDGTTGHVEVRSGRMTWAGRPAMLTMAQDVTDRVRLEEELREAQKLEAVGRLAGGIAHDFNNLLTGVLCNAQLLKSMPDAARDVCDAADVIEKAARRAGELTGQLLGFARRGKRQDVAVDLGAVIRSVIRLTSGALDPRISVETVLPRDPVLARGDPAQMEQVALNLAMNARDAMAEGGRLVFAAETAELDAAHAGRYGASPGRYAVLRVSDTGCGMAEDVRVHIFEPFFTTKPEGKGIGMGLAMVYGIARNHGGWVEVESEVGCGSTLRVYLPGASAAEEQAAAPEPERRVRPAGGVECGGRSARTQRRGERRAKRTGMRSSMKEPPVRSPRSEGRAQRPCILVVDDDEFVRHALTRMLGGMGYSVVTAASGREAVATYGMFGPSVGAVILDMAMPDMDGQQCFRALRRLDPDVKVILCTGGPADAATESVLGQDAAGFIQKPYQGEQLGAAIAKALEGR